MYMYCTYILQVYLCCTCMIVGPLTLFGPTNEAFAALPEGLVNYLKKNKTALAEVLEYHVLASKVMSTDLKNELLAPTLLKGKSVRANIYGEVLISPFQCNESYLKNFTRDPCHFIS